MNYNCLNCSRCKLTYADDGYSYVAECPMLEDPIPLSPASLHSCTEHIHSAKPLVVPYEDILRYIIDFTADRAGRSTEQMGENSLFSEYPNLYPRLRGMIAYILSSQFAVSIPESEYSGWQTFGQAANTVFKHQYRR